MLINRCHHPLVLEAAMLLLSEYPQSYDMNVRINGSDCALSSDLFIQHAYLQQTKQAFEEAVSSAQHSLIRAACDVFSTWASSCSQELEAEMEQILNERAAFDEDEW